MSDPTVNLWDPQPTDPASGVHGRAELAVTQNAVLRYLDAALAAETARAEAAEGTLLVKANNLSDVASKAAGRNSLGPEFWVDAYPGADPTGATSSQTALNAAQAAAVAAGGGTVVFSPGIWQVQIQAVNNNLSIGATSPSVHYRFSGVANCILTPMAANTPVIQSTYGTDYASFDINFDGGYSIMPHPDSSTGPAIAMSNFYASNLGHVRFIRNPNALNATWNTGIDWGCQQGGTYANTFECVSVLGDSHGPIPFGYALMGSTYSATWGSANMNTVERIIAQGMSGKFCCDLLQTGGFVLGTKASLIEGNTFALGSAVNVTGATFTGTSVTLDVADTADFTVGMPIVVAAVGGLTNVDGNWIITSVVANTSVTFSVTTAPTGSYTSGGTVTAAGCAVKPGNKFTMGYVYFEQHDGSSDLCYDGTTSAFPTDCLFINNWFADTVADNNPYIAVVGGGTINQWRFVGQTHPLWTNGIHNVVQDGAICTFYDTSGSDEVGLILANGSPGGSTWALGVPSTPSAWAAGLVLLDVTSGTIPFAIGNGAPQYTLQLNTHGAVFSAGLTKSTQAVTVAAAATTLTLAPATYNNFVVTLDNTAACAISITNPAYVGFEAMLDLILGASGSYTLPASVKFTGGAAPTPSTTVGYRDVYKLMWDGTYWVCISSAIGVH